MEGQDEQLQSLTWMQNMASNTGVNVVPEQKQENNDLQLEAIDGTLDPETDLQALALIDNRMQRLQSRSLLLLEMQQIKGKAENRKGSREELTSEDGNAACELEVIQKELEELEKRRNELLVKPAEETFPPPPPPLFQEVTLEEQEVEKVPEKPSGPIIPVECLGKTAEVTRCPSCQQVVITNVKKRTGGTIFLVCCLFSMVGCVAGCCLAPFCMDNLKNVRHSCPACLKHIHTYTPL